MRRNLLFGLTLMASLMSATSAFPADEAALRSRLERRTYQSADGQTLPYRLAIPKNYNPAKKYPLVVFLHGAGERGTDNEAQLVHPQVLRLIGDEAARQPCFLVAPQCPTDCRWVEVPWESPTPHETPAEPSRPMRLTLELLDSLEKEFSIDPARRYATGLSMGGYGTFDLLVRRPHQFAAAIAVCGGADDSKASQMAGTALWVFHGNKDGAVPVARSRSIVAALKQAGADVKYTEYDGAGHDVWSRAYLEPGLVEWLFSKSR
jgi:predicted peptidase